MQRVSVVGSSGSGKTTLARALAERLGAVHVELDAIFHQPGWTPLPDADFQARAAVATAGDRWVIDGNYSLVRPAVWERADTVVFLDLPRWRVMARLVPRSLRRSWTGEELWNGNREEWQFLRTLRAEENILVWSWQRHGRQRRRYLDAVTDPRWAHLHVVRLCSPVEVDRWLAAVPAPPPTGT